mmetsp:Transcript_30605/g.57323  ORF Transcript_30605/g.57323 Transcript_30605/m.57323 type:complete len:212 (-) Transcript_30605:91-726(-)
MAILSLIPNTPWYTLTWVLYCYRLWSRKNTLFPSYFTLSAIDSMHNCIFQKRWWVISHQLWGGIPGRNNLRRPLTLYHNFVFVCTIIEYIASSSDHPFFTFVIVPNHIGLLLSFSKSHNRVYARRQNHFGILCRDQDSDRKTRSRLVQVLQGGGSIACYGHDLQDSRSHRRTLGTSVMRSRHRRRANAGILCDNFVDIVNNNGPSRSWLFL